MYTVYLVVCSDDSLYCGIALDAEKRVAKHNSSKGSKYTRSRLPVFLVYTEECCTKSQALQREYAIKQLTREEKLEMIEKAKVK